MEYIQGVGGNKDKLLAKLSRSEAQEFVRKRGNNPLPWHITSELPLSLSSWSSLQRATVEYADTTYIYVYASDWDSVMGTSASIYVYRTAAGRGRMYCLISKEDFRAIYSLNLGWYSAGNNQKAMEPPQDVDPIKALPSFTDGYYWVGSTDLDAAILRIGRQPRSSISIESVAHTLEASPILISPQQAAIIFNDGLGKLFSEYNGRVKTWVNEKQKEIDELRGKPSAIESAVKTVVAAMDMVRFIKVVAKRGQVLLEDTVELDMYDVPQKQGKNFTTRRD